MIYQFTIKKIIMQKLKRYNENLKIVQTENGSFVQSYSTLVAKIEKDQIKQLGYWSMTTQKHINYVANELNLKLIKP